MELGGVREEVQVVADDSVEGVVDACEDIEVTGTAEGLSKAEAKS